MEKPKIAFFLPGLGLVNRGAEHFVLELSKRLQGNYEITYFCRGRMPENWVPVKGISRDNKLIGFFSRKPFLKTVLKAFLLDSINVEWLSSSFDALPKFLRSNFDLIIPEAGMWGNLACRIVRRIKGIPFVDIAHSKYGYWEFLSALQRPDAYVSPNRYNHKVLTKKFKRINSVVIPHGVDLKKYSPEIIGVSLALQRPIFLCVGALDPVKRIHLAIQAVFRQKKGSLVVIGSGRLRKKIQEMGNKLLGERFLLTDVPSSHLPSFYAACDVYTLPSAHEAFGITYLEAMACNKPVVSCRDEIREEIIGDAGILCDCTDIKKYSHALELAANKDFGTRPRRQAEKYSWEMVALKYDELLRSIIEKSRKSHTD